MSIKRIEKKWLQNFKDSPLVTDGVFNVALAYKLFYGFHDDENPPFEMGFESFFDCYYRSNVDENVEILIKYLSFIGITIKSHSIIDAVKRKDYSYNQILQKAFYIFKHLANYDDSLDINDPYYDNMGDLYFFLRIAEGNIDSPKQLTFFDELELPEFYNKYIELPENYENDDVSIKLFNLIEGSNKSIFLTGKAGTGKSTFIHYLTTNTAKNVLLLAFTGIASINIGGQTIHSFFRFPLKPLMPNDPDIPVFKHFYQKYKIIEKTDTIIIDEVSMLRADILEGLDYSLRINGGNPDCLFGGKQMIFVGDIFQLPPIVQVKDEVEKVLFNKIYDSEYFFDSNSYKSLDPLCFEFDKIYRQQDINFIDLLNKVRECNINQQEIEKLNECFNPNLKPNPDHFFIALTTNNYLARQKNSSRLANLPYKSFFYQAVINGDFNEDRYPTEPILELKRNSQVMLIKNDSIENGRRWVNGTIAKVEFLDNDMIEIKLRDGSIHTLFKELWENRKYQWDKNKKEITSKVIGTFEQYPLKLAWAITIHKSQGLTFDNVELDLGSGAFINGQLYTALSRCRSLNGLVLKRRIRMEDVIEDPRILSYHRKKICKSTKRILERK
ncbi:MAG TPA: hypothetical protein ENO27_03300 [Caldithrix sp.]|nr:hypothetical protein [Caldithrix sp.]